MAFDFGAFISGLEKKARRALPTATRRAYAPALSPGTIFSSAKPPVTVPGAILGLTGKATERVMLPVAIYEQGRQVFNPQDNILTRIGDLGSGIRNLASGKDYLEGRTTPLQRAQVGQPMVLGGQLGYKAADGTWQPRADMESENIPQYLPGSPQADKRGYVWDSNPAAERAYEQEKSRVAQLTEQDPELKRYEETSKKAKTQEEMNAARDIGMAIWARANPKLAAKVKPGQSGYEVIQNEINAGQMGPVLDLPFDTTKPFSPTPIPPEQRSVTYEGVRPVSLGEVKPIAGGGFPTAQAAMFERFAQPAAPTFQGSPLGTASPLVGNLSYTGSVSPLGLAVEEGDFRSAKAQQLADAFKKARFSS